MNTKAFEHARRALAAAQRIVAFTGSGISAESGIPTFRGSHGLWAEAPPDLFGTPAGLLRLLQHEPHRLAGMLRRIGTVLLQAEANPAHHALAALAAQGRLRALITQNVDDLHEQAGLKDPIKLHGDLFRWRCLGCGEYRHMSRIELDSILSALAEIDFSEQLLDAVPRCACGERLRPDLVLFGEWLDGTVLAAAEAALAEADIVLAVGTSGLIQPATGLLEVVAERGTPIIEINLEAGALSPFATWSLFAPAGQILPRLLAP